MKSMMNKASIFIAMICLMTAVLVGCRDKAADTNTTEKITLQILENDTAKEKGYLDELLNAFNEAYAEQGIEAVDANMDEYSNLAENGPYGYGPDVLYQANDKLMTYASDKHLLAIDPEEFDCNETTADSAWEAFELAVDGEIYTCGIPVNVQEPMLFYRDDLMPSDWETEWDDDKNGVADFLENWNDLYNFSKQIKEGAVDNGCSFGYMSSLNNLYLNSNFIFTYGAYIFGENDDGTLDTKDIGFAANDATAGISALIQFAELMDEGCIDETITSNRYEKLAAGEYFCVVSTPDTYTVFVEKLQLHYEEDGLSSEEAYNKAVENIKMIELPGLMPADGDLSKDSSEVSEWVDTIVMGGINGYGISAYTKHREAAIEFVNFATSYEMITKRAQMLGIAATRSDVAAEAGTNADAIFASLNEGKINLMPSVKAVDQIWTPMQTMMGDFAKDAFRTSAEKKYATSESIKAALEKVNTDIYNAIYTLADS